VLIGDSGEADPEIYREVVRRHPERIRAIYIRSVDPDPRRIAAIGTLSREVAQTGCQLVLAADSLAAAAHAAGEGLIQPSDLRAVRADCRSDASMPSKVAASTGSLK
jgi:phosphatidate phosphatase APP1